MFAANKEFFRLSLHKATSWQIKIYSYLNSLKLFVAKRIESVIQSKCLWAHSKAILACNSNVDHTVIWHLFISFNNLIMVIIFLCICHSIFNLNILDYTANISVVLSTMFGSVLFLTGFLYKLSPDQVLSMTLFFPAFGSSFNKNMLWALVGNFVYSTAFDITSHSFLYQFGALNGEVHCSTHLCVMF